MTLSLSLEGPRVTCPYCFSLPASKNQKIKSQRSALHVCHYRVSHGTRVASTQQCCTCGTITAVGGKYDSMERIEIEEQEIDGNDSTSLCRFAILLLLSYLSIKKANNYSTIRSCKNNGRKYLKGDCNPCFISK